VPFDLLTLILLGIIEGGGGVTFVPGRGPVPVPTPGLRESSPALRDAFLGLAIHALASMIEDEQSRHVAQRTGLQGIEQAGRQLRVT
jgi:hypothetical protein